MNTCDKCQHWHAPGHWAGKNDGSCDLVTDSNDGGKEYKDRCRSWDYESYSSGLYVPPKFGCIHWSKKESNK